MDMFGKIFKSSKEKVALTPKKMEEMPHVKLNMDYKIWCDSQPAGNKWKTIRWSVLIFMNLLFVLSFALDLSLLEGSLSGSRMFGFYLMDPFNSLQLLAISSKTGYIVHLTTNFVIGTVTIILFYFFLGGRTFCSWLCPYHFLAEMAERLHDYLVKKKKIKDHKYHLGLRYVFWFGFLALAFFTANLVFEDINPVGIISRAIIYGPGIILIWVLALLLFEVFYSKRFWCRYVCPIGTTYTMIGKPSPLTIKFELDKCGYCADCQTVCLVPHELWFVKRGKATQEIHYTGSDCTNCGLCIDTCAGNALTYVIKGWEKIL